MKHLLVISILLFYSIPACYGSAIADSWTKDIIHQPLSRRPKIEARYTDATRTALDLDAQNYRLVIELKSDLGQRIRSLRAKGPKGFDEILASGGIYLEITDSNDITYSSLNSKEASRINIYRRGPYYIETHWLDIQLADLTGKLAPVRGEVVLYSYPEKTHVGVIMHVTGMIEVKSASIVFDSNAETCAGPVKCELEGGVRINDFVVLNRGEDNPTCALIYPALNTADDVTMEKIDKGVRITTYIYNAEAHGGTSVKWDNGHKPSSFFEIFPMQKLELSDAFQSEIKPLLSTSMTAKSGRTLGYDPIRGCYKIQTDNLGSFSYHYEHPNDYEAAIAALKKALELDPASAEAHVFLAKAYTESGRMDEGLAEAETALASDPKSYWVQSGYGYVRALRAEWELAVPPYREAVTLQPNFAFLQLLLAEALRETGQYDEAIAFARGALKLGQGFEARGYRSLGHALWRKGDLDGAAANFQKSLDLDDTDPYTHWGLGAVYYRKGDYEAALPHLQRAALLLPGEAGYHAWLGACLFNLQRYEEARAELEWALRLDPNNEDAKDLLQKLDSSGH